MSEMKDRHGREIEIGSYVTWPTQNGHSVSVRDGTVIKINPRSVRIKVDVEVHPLEYPWSAPEVTVTKTQNITVLREAEDEG